MLVGKIIVAALKANAGVTAAVGDRIVPETDAQDTVFPRIIYHADDPDLVTSYSGTNALTKQTITIAAVSETYAQAEAVGLLVYKALQDKDGMFAGIQVLDMSRTAEREDTFNLNDDPDSVVYTKELDFGVWFYTP